MHMYDVWQGGEWVWGDSHGGGESLDSVSAKQPFYGHANSSQVCRGEQGLFGKPSRSQCCSAAWTSANILLCCWHAPIGIAGCDSELPKKKCPFLCAAGLFSDMLHSGHGWPNPPPPQQNNACSHQSCYTAVLRNPLLFHAPSTQSIIPEYVGLKALSGSSL